MNVQARLLVLCTICTVGLAVAAEAPAVATEHWQYPATVCVPGNGGTYYTDYTEIETRQEGFVRILTTVAAAGEGRESLSCPIPMRSDAYLGYTRVYYRDGNNASGWDGRIECWMEYHSMVSPWDYTYAGAHEYTSDTGTGMSYLYLDGYGYPYEYNTSTITCRVPRRDLIGGADSPSEILGLDVAHVLP